MRSRSFSVPVEFHVPEVNAGPDLELLPGKTTRLRVSGAVRYDWSPGTYLNNTTSSDPLLTPYDDISYFVTGYDNEGCAATDTLNIKVLKTTLVEVPTAFTPNSDGLNDDLKPLLYGIKELEHFMVFNRWGQKVFDTNVIGEGWDGNIGGKPQDSGTYVWTLRVIDNSGNMISKKGWTTLIR